ncbi:ARF GTPase-activating protein GIT2 [Thelohanellus kitauei]|uniref:ARF GTPase-activating protein GIT2 n=1 Tax=Thelohanellus kitauei TaxID=669202 RepID=A0A0C2M2R0_THEKT|nr:ARF GTPase-activating protein GIT2 [Thelohanellus kitauei]
MDYKNLPCSDCGYEGCNWLSLNNFVILCDRCVVVHFNLGSMISQIYHINHLSCVPSIFSKLFDDMWTRSAHALWVQNLKNFLELNPSRSRIYPQSNKNERKEFIQLKYKQRTFLTPMSNSFEADIVIKNTIKNGDQIGLFRSIINNADLEAKDPNGQSLIHIAVKDENKHALAMLYLWGANIYENNSFMESAIDIAVEAKNTSMISALIEIIMEIPDMFTLYLAGYKPDHEMDVHLVLPNLSKLGFNQDLPCVEMSKFLKKVHFILFLISSEDFTDLSSDIYEECVRRLCEAENKKCNGIPEAFRILPMCTLVPDPRNKFRASLSKYDGPRFALLLYHLLYEISQFKGTNAINEVDFKEKIDEQPIIRYNIQRKDIWREEPKYESSSNPLESYLHQKTSTDVPKKQATPTPIIHGKPPPILDKQENHESKSSSTPKINEKEKFNRWKQGFDDVVDKLFRIIELTQRSVKVQNGSGVKKGIVDSATNVKSLITFCQNCSIIELKSELKFLELVSFVKRLNEVNNGPDEAHKKFATLTDILNEFKSALDVLNDRVQKFS